MTEERRNEHDDTGRSTSRRTVLKLAGVSAMSLAGCISGEDGPGGEAATQVAYGYGGQAMVVEESDEQHSLEASSPSEQSAFVQSLTGRLQAENFDRGGEGVAYHDTTAENEGFGYREDSGVDIQPVEDVGGGYNVGWMREGEWLEYTVAVTDGTYDIHARLDSPSGEGSLLVKLDGEVLAEFDLPKTDEWMNFQTVTVPNVQISGTRDSVLRLESKARDFNINWLEFLPSTGADPSTPTETATPTPTPTETPTPTPTPTPAPEPGQEPYGGAPLSIPGTVQAEEFDTGGEGVAYHDVTDGNSGGEYRPDGRVDVQETDDVDGGYNVGWMRDGEWLEYTTAVEQGTYDVHLRVASPQGGARLELSMDDATLGAIDVPETGGWQDWRTVTLRDVPLAAGDGRVLRLDVDGDQFNVNWLDFELVASTDPPTETPTPTETTTQTPTETTTPAPDDYGDQGYGQLEYGG